ncbi:hypothetical protein E8E12_007357 [Didymella heteroderae]|uniref:Amidohydrolase-related domain-containing protein n=1 Tax=Didymella heteroderae TaxID=1769908 RepID=A0A9P4WL56_9PLEO|nr:hypothetical protein E8E12_007357 [Didymella heteroderae]
MGIRICYPYSDFASLVLHLLLRIRSFQDAAIYFSTTIDGSSRFRIIENAKKDGIDLVQFNWTNAAIAEIGRIRQDVMPLPDFSRATKIDIHSHIIPSFYEALVKANLPSNRVPAWNLQDHLAFMSANGIARSVVSISTPGANIFPSGNAAPNSAVARLTNEYMFALAKTYPERFSFVANMPLPYIEESIVEARYAFDKLNTSGIGLLSSHEGQYHGSKAFARFYEYLDTKSTGVFYHPTIPLQEVNGTLVPAYPSYGFVFAPFDFLFDTARNIMNMTAAQTMRENRNLRFGFAHCAGAWASVADRYFGSPVYGPTESWENYAEIFQTRAFYDTAGPMVPHAVQGLFAYEIPKTQLMYGTDFPYSIEIQNLTGALLNALIDDADFFSEDEKKRIFESNAKAFLDI